MENILMSTDTKSLQLIQGTAARYITSSLHGTAYDVMETHRLASH